MHRKRTKALHAAGELALSLGTPAHGHRPLARPGRRPLREDAGPALPAHQAYGVEAVLLEMATQRDLGVLHVHGIRRAPAQPGEVEPSLLVEPGDLTRRPGI